MKSKTSITQRAFNVTTAIQESRSIFLVIKYRKVSFSQTKTGLINKVPCLGTPDDVPAETKKYLQTCKRNCKTMVKLKISLISGITKV